MADDENYVTVMPTWHPHKFLVAVMYYSKVSDDYCQGRVSQPLPIKAADDLAKSWAAALKLEIR